MTTISLLSLWFYRSCVCTVVLTSTFLSNSRHRGIIARKTWESQISLTNSKIPWLFSKFQISLTNYKIPWLFPDLEFPWLFPDQWQSCLFEQVVVVYFIEISVFVACRHSSPSQRTKSYQSYGPLIIRCPLAHPHPTPTLTCMTNLVNQTATKVDTLGPRVNNFRKMLLLFHT